MPSYHQSFHSTEEQREGGAEQLFLALLLKQVFSFYGSPLPGILASLSESGFWGEGLGERGAKRSILCVSKQRESFAAVHVIGGAANHCTRACWHAQHALLDPVQFLFVWGFVGIEEGQVVVVKESPQQGADGYQ